MLDVAQVGNGINGRAQAALAAPALGRWPRNWPLIEETGPGVWQAAPRLDLALKAAAGGDPGPLAALGDFAYDPEADPPPECPWPDGAQLDRWARRIQAFARLRRRDLPPAAPPAAATKIMRPKQKQVQLPDGTRIDIDSLKALDRWRGVFCNSSRTSLFRRSAEPGGGEAEDEAPRFRRIDAPDGMPVLVRVLRPASDGAARRADEEIRYELSWSTRPESGIKSVSGKQLQEGTCWEEWGNLAISAKKDINHYADVVKLQGHAFGIPIIIVPRRTGLTEISPGSWRYILPDGRWIGADGASGGTAGDPGIYHHLFPLAREWADGFAELPTVAPDPESIAELGRFAVECDPKGRILAGICMAARSLVTSIVPAGTSALLVGPTRAGKTSLVNFARGIIGPCPFKARPDANFENSQARVEISIRPLWDMPVSLDDARMHEGSTRAEEAATGTTLAHFLTSAGDGVDMRGLATRDRQAAEDSKVSGFGFCTAQRLPRGIDAGRLARAAVMRLDRGEIDHDYLADGWQPHQPTLTAAGHEIIRRTLAVLACGPDGMDELRRHIIAAETAFTAEIVGRLARGRPQADREFVYSFAANFARAMTGAWLIDEACGSALIEHLRPFIVELAADSLDFATTGAASTIDREWLAGVIRRALTNKRAHVLSSTDELLSNQHPSARLSDYGYDGELPRGGRLGWTEGLGRPLLLLQKAVFDLAYEEARREDRLFPWSTQTFPSFVVRCGLAEPGTKGSSMHRPRIAGEERPWVLTIPHGHIFGGEDDEPTDDAAPAADPAPIGAWAMPPSGLFARKASSRIIRDDPAPPPAAAARADGRTARPRGTAPRPASQELQKPISRSGGAFSGNRIDEPPPIAVARILPAAESASGARPASDAQRAKPRPGAAGEGPKSYRRRPAATAPKEDRGLALAVLDADRLRLITPAGIEARNHDQPTCPRTELDPLLNWGRDNRVEQLNLHASWHAGTLPQEWTDENGKVRRFLTRDGLAHPWAVLPESSPWTLSVPGKLMRSMWAKRRDGSCTIEIRLPAYDQPDRNPLHNAASGEILAHALAEFRNATAEGERGGFPLRNSPAKTFQAMFRALARDRQHNNRIVDVMPELAPIDYPPPAHAMPECVADIAWARPKAALSAAETAAAWCEISDGNGQYLRQMGSLSYGLGKVTHCLRPRFDPKRAGWWLLRYRIVRWPAELPPPGWPLPPGEEGWLPTETLAFLLEDGKASLSDLSEAWLWDRSERALDRLQARLSTARSRLLLREADETLSPVERTAAALARKVHSTAYKSGIGQWTMVENRNHTGVLFEHRPHFRHAIMAASTAGILRDLWRVWQKTGQCPIAIATDGLAYLTDRPDTLLKRGTALGQYKPVRTIPAAAMREKLAALPSREAVETPFAVKAHNEALGAILGLITGKGE